jgi:hypothetical protein
VAINPQSDSRIRMSHLSFRDSRIRSYVHQQTRVAMPKRVHASAFNLELVEDRPKAILDNFVRCIGSPVAIKKEKALGIRWPRRQIFFQHRDERFRHRYGSTTRLALHRLHSAVPGRSLDVNNAAVQVEVRFLQSHDFADAQSSHCRDREHGAIWFRSKCDDVASLFPVEESCLFANLIRRQRQLACSNRLRAVAPRLRRAHHRAENAEDVEHGFARHLLRKQRDEVLLDLRREFMEKDFPQMFADVGP